MTKKKKIMRGRYSRRRSKILPIVGGQRNSHSLIKRRSKVESIERLLSEDESLGPLEPTDTKSEFDDFSSSDLDVKLLLALASEDDVICDLMCIPKYYIHYDPFALSHVRFASSKGGGGIRAGILVTEIGTETPLLHIHDDMHEMISKCETRGKRFVIFNTGLYWRNRRGGHANAVIFDTKTKTIERYDPEGMKGSIPNLRETLLREFPGWKYVGPGKEMPRGTQQFADSFTGMCVTFSLYFFLLRLSNPDETAVAVYKYILERHQEGKLTGDVLRLNKFAASKLRSIRKGVLREVRSGSGGRRGKIGHGRYSSFVSR